MSGGIADHPPPIASPPRLPSNVEGQMSPPIRYQSRVVVAHRVHREQSFV